MKLIAKFALVYFSCGISFFGYHFITYEATAIKHVANLSENTKYVIKSIRPDDLPLQRAGRLGAFYSCIVKYDGSGSWRSSKPNSGIWEEVTLKLEDRTELEIDINAMEGNRFYLTRYDEAGNRIDYSQGRPINCDMNLLDKPLETMECEDKLFNNVIRPACVYVPK